jgi:hypothetical protein
MSVKIVERGWLWALTGLGFVVAAGSGILFSMLLPPEPYPSPFGPPLGPQTDVAQFFIDARPEVLAMSFLYTIAAILLVAFVAFVASAMTRQAGAINATSALALGGGLLAAAFWLLAAMLLWVLARPWTPEQPNLVRAMHDLTYLLGGPAHVLMLGLFVGAGATSMPRDTRAKTVLYWIGVAAAGLSLLSVAALLVDSASLVLPVGRGLAMLWIAGVSISLALAANEPRERPAVHPTMTLGSRAH